MAEVHLWRLPIRPLVLAQIAKEHRIPFADEDQGYTIHALLKALWPEVTPKPWRWVKEKRLLWAYAPRSLAAMRSQVDSVDPLYLAAIDWNGAASKLMPCLLEGKVVGFDLRACPVVRHGKGEGDKASEHDYLVWLAHQKGMPANELDPRHVYREWLCERLWKEEKAGARLLPARVAVVGWQKPMEGYSNRWRGRRGKGVRLPEVCFSGGLEVTDPDRFLTFLSQGVGRHRAFGYGMLLLKSWKG